VRSAAQIGGLRDTLLSGSEAGLVAYYPFGRSGPTAVEDFTVAFGRMRLAEALKWRAP